MTAIRYFALLTIGVAVIVGCSKRNDAPPAKTDAAQAPAPKAEDEAKIKTALAKLSDADRPLAESQKFCPVQKSRLGSMGKPARIELDGQPVFLCCAGCEDDARANAKKTLEQVAQWRKAN